MRKLLVFILAVFVVLVWGCGKSGNSDLNRVENPQAKPQAKKDPAETGAPTKPEQRSGSKPQGEDIDVDKLDIPDQLKEAIKSGRIPKDRIPEILARARGQGAMGGEATPVSVGSVSRKGLNSYLVLNGIVEPERKVEVFSRLSAYVKEIVKEEGAYVKENDVLALLDDTEIKIGYEQTKIQLEQAKLSLEEAETNYLRNQELIKRTLISEQEFQTQEAQYKQRQLDYKDRMESFKDLQLQLNWTKIRAPSEGFITERLIEKGDRVNQNQQVYTIEDFRPLLIRVFVPTSDAIKLESGMPAEVTTEVLKGTMFAGNVKLINPRIDVQTGTVKVTVETFDDSLRLKPGMFVEVRIVIGKKEDVLVIPRKALLYKQNKTYVFVMDQNHVSQREVLLGLTEEDDVEVTSGLNEGEVIVVVGVEGLQDGQRIDVVQ
ncbi:MAG: efflux RND transporter periplasmic adaptor subunit [Candidatus Aminicenantes bacterium]|nr:efflux RND transporter periplasmic adaptor subunit [Candidatus Aminicenantes bacterium]MDH5385818.1 efflux RND transporter periplasmic adaptor subunit [Candidatus Aminicenantes bacterium]MDH5744855.1 efflux RND transporter periplasmic adaptor subunit [Candidatus Aminicenantes bacterium]